MIQRPFSILCIVLLVSGCATAPRGPASTLAEAGSKTALSLGSDVRTTANRIAYADVINSFERTWKRCNSNPNICAVAEPSEANIEARQKLAKAVRYRSIALSGLAGAYDAMAVEADYDARADLEGSIKNAVDSVNAYSGIFGLAPGANILSGQIGNLAALSGGLLAERSQRKRLMRASQMIGATTRQMQLALEQEANVHKSLQAYLIDSRADAKRAFLDAGLISRSSIISPLANELGVDLAKDADKNIGKSTAAQKAVEAALLSLARAEIAAAQAQYDASIAALGALMKAHRDFESQRPVAIEDVARFLAELDAALAEPVAGGE